MGYPNSEPHALVVMTNSDVYYVTPLEAVQLADYIKDKEPLFEFDDIKSGKNVHIQVPHVSSIVEGGSQNG